jgi:cell division protein FtsQ
VPATAPAKTRTRRPPARRQPSLIRLKLARFAPSRHSVAIGLGIVAVAVGAYAIARETSLFAIDRIDVTGGSPALDAQVARALEPFAGKSLVGLDGGAVLRRAGALPMVVNATYDRAFPNTLRVTIVPERAVAVLRGGTVAWVVSARGRVMRAVGPSGAPSLPRIWLAKATTAQVGEILPLQLGRATVRAIASAGSLASHVATASVADGTLVFHLRSGLELVLGSPVNVALKAEVAAKVLAALPSGTRLVDVSLPDRPVTSTHQSSSGG